MRIRTKLTLWYSLLTTLLLIILIPLIYFPLKHSLLSNEENLLQLHATEASINFEGVSVPNLSAQMNSSSNLGTFLAVYDASNTIITSDSYIPERLLQEKNSMGEIRIINTNQGKWLLIDQIIDDEGVEKTWLRGVRSLDTYNRTLSDFRRFLFVIIPIYLVIAFLGGIIVTKKALVPLTQMASTAQEIGHGKLDKRLSLDLPANEIGILALTFNDMLNRLELSFQKEKQFTSDASHELKTPIAVIQAHTENALSLSKNQGELEQSLNIIYQEAKSMNRIVSQLLLLTRSDSSNNSVLFEKLNLSYIVEDCISTYIDSSNNSTSNTTTINSDIEPLIYIMGDQTLMTRLFVNLIENSIKYGKESNNIFLSLHQEKNIIKFLIKDNGIGISPTDIPQIFDPFYRSSETRSLEGSGLGLALVKKIIELHNGEITVESTENSGTTFEILLPIDGSSS